MSTLVLICSLLHSTLLFKLVACDVQSCYACAGPKSVCVSNNRTDFLKMDCSTFEVEGQSLIQWSSQVDLLEKFDSEVGRDEEEESEVGCITLTFTHDGQVPQERALKSCIPKQVFGVDVCKYMEQLVSEIGGQKQSCQFCRSDDCNSSVSFDVCRYTIISLCIIYFCNYLL